MYIERRSKGSYRIVQMVKGKTYRISVDHKPTKSEAMELISQAVSNAPKRPTVKASFSDCAQQYIDDKGNILSPSTLYGYRNLKRLIDTSYPGFAKLRLCDIGDPDIQRLINDYSAGHSPKSVSNLIGFISPVLKYFDKSRQIYVTTPQKRDPDLYTPDDDEVEKLIKRIEGTEFEIPVMLGAFALRRSEICALTIDDFDFKDNSVFIHKAKLRGRDGGWVIVERNKTARSRRKVYLPDIICRKVAERGYVYRGDPNDISVFMRKVETELDINHFSLHRLRSYYASISDYLHAAEVTILDQGGWSSPHVMKKIYRKKLEDKNKKAAARTVRHFEELIQ